MCVVKELMAGQRNEGPEALGRRALAAWGASEGQVGTRHSAQAVPANTRASGGGGGDVLERGGV